MPNERDDLARVLYDKIREEYGHEAYTHNLDDAVRYADAILAQWVPEHDRAVRAEQRERDDDETERERAFRAWRNDPDEDSEWASFWGGWRAHAAAIRAKGTDR